MQHKKKISDQASVLARGENRMEVSEEERSQAGNWLVNCQESNQIDRSVQVEAVVV